MECKARVGSQVCKRIHAKKKEPDYTKLIYSNSATSVGVHAVVLMRPEDGPVDGWDGSDNDRVNDRRDANFIVREDMFEDGLEIALHKVSGGGGGEEGEAQNEVDVEYVRGIETLNF